MAGTRAVQRARAAKETLIKQIIVLGDCYLDGEVKPVEEFVLGALLKTGVEALVVRSIDELRKAEQSVTNEWVIVTDPEWDMVLKSNLAQSWLLFVYAEGTDWSPLRPGAEFWMRRGHKERERFVRLYRSWLEKPADYAR